MKQIIFRFFYILHFLVDIALQQSSAIVAILINASRC